MAQKILRGFVCSASFVFSLLSYSQIYQIKTFAEIDRHLERHPEVFKKDTWVVLDVDNTLITPDISVKPELTIKATDAYFYELRHRYYEEEIKKTKDAARAKVIAYKRAAESWNDAVKQGAAWKKLDPKIEEWLHSKREHFIMGLTAREDVLVEATTKSLKELGIKLNPELPHHSFSFPAELPFHAQTATYKNGVFHVGSGGTKTVHHKGKRFLHFIEMRNRILKNKKLPKYLVFVDDRMEHVKGMVEELKTVGITVLGFNIVVIPERS